MTHEIAGGVVIEPLDMPLGIRVRGVDIAGALPSHVAEALRKALHQYGVLMISNQDVTDDAHASFARIFGSLQAFPRANGKTSEIFRAANIDEQGRLLPQDADAARLLRLNWLWHIDSCYSSAPVAGVALRAVTVVEHTGGDTMFANLAAAYEALPAHTKDRIEGLRVRHSFEHLVRNQDVPELSEEEIGHLPSAEHPLVRDHSDGRRSLFLSPPYMETVVGWTRDDSASLFQELMEWATQQRFTYTHQWRLNDVIVWDNHWTMHRVTPYDMHHDARDVRGATICEFAG